MLIRSYNYLINCDLALCIRQRKMHAIKVFNGRKGNKYTVHNTSSLKGAPSHISTSNLEIHFHLSHYFAAIYIRTFY